MAGMSHAGVVRVEHAAVAVGSAMIVAMLPLWFLSGEAQAAGSESTPDTSAAVAVPNSPATPGSSSHAGASQPSRGAATSDRSHDDEPARPIPVAVAPRDRLAPRALEVLAEPEGPQAFSEAAPQVSSAAGEAPASPPPAPSDVDLSHTPSGWFTPVSKYYFSARFGVPGPWASGHHTGLDFVTKEGTPIRAATGGVVVAADWAGAYGQLLQIKIGPKTQIWMAHLDKFAVHKGDVVQPGQVVGFVGMTGHTTGPHCHFEVRVKDKPVNPEPYFWPDGNSVTRIGRR